jgi:hypothetical protein
MAASKRANIACAFTVAFRLGVLVWSIRKALEGTEKSPLGLLASLNKDYI